jgi:ABC-type glycerol-3-phosphate transport system permease component
LETTAPNSVITQEIPRRRFRFSLKYLIIYLFLGFYTASSILAFTWVIMVSLKTNPEFLATSPWSLPETPQWQNYITAWNRNISRMFQNSLLVAGGATVLSVAISCMAAYPIARIPFRWNQPVLIFFLLGIMIPYMLTAIPLYFMVENVRQTVPIDSRIILIVLYIVAGFPFNTYVMTGFFKTLPTELEEAAAVDGASPFRTFWQIMLPLATPGVASLLILNFLSWWNEFFYALLFVREREQYTMPLGLMFLDQQAQYTARWVDLFAGMVLSVVPVLIVFALLQNRITQGLTVGAVKG